MVTTSTSKRCRPTNALKHSQGSALRNPFPHQDEPTDVSSDGVAHRALLELRQACAAGTCYTRE
jgi:hypothetical protein